MGNQEHTADLLPGAVLPNPYDGESLFSWCARFHRLNGGVNACTTSQYLFDHPTIGIRQHDLPCHLGHFVGATNQRLGGIAEVISERTQFPLFAPFLDVDSRQNVVAMMGSNEFNDVRKLLGINRAGLGTVASLKYCRECMSEDLATAPMAWWHIEHQWPSTWICVKHGCPLEIATQQLHGRRLGTWHLPGELACDYPEAWPHLSAHQVKRLIAIARCTRGLAAEREIHLDALTIRYTYLLRAKERGWVAMDGSLRFAALRDAFSANHSGLELLPGLSFLAASTSANGGFLRLLLHDYPGRKHPAKHILLIAFLFDEFEEFRVRYEETRRFADTAGVEGLKARLANTRRRLKEMITVEGRSVNATSQVLGIAPTQAINYLRKEGIPYQQRPRVLTAERESKLHGLLRTGQERREIAQVLSIRVAFIKDYLATHSDLRAAWKEARRTRQIEEYRAHFLAVLKGNPSLSLKRLAAIPGSGVGWLKRNDPAWLAAHLPAIWNQPMNRGLSDGPMLAESTVECPIDAPTKRPGTNN